MQRFFANHTVARAADGSTFAGRFDGQGGEFFVPLLLGTFLSVLTLGIYLPWFLCSFQRLVATHTAILQDGKPIGTMEFVGKGGELLGTAILGTLLTVITLGIYGAWYHVQLLAFFSRNLRVQMGDQSFSGDFAGTGFEYFKLTLVGSVLTLLTLGVYGFWYLANLLRFQLGSSTFRSA